MKILYFKNTLQSFLCGRNHNKFIGFSEILIIYIIYLSNWP